MLRGKPFKKGAIPWNKGKKCPKISFSLRGRKHSEEAKEKMRQKALGRKMPISTRLAINKAIKGKPAWNRGKPHSEATKQKIKKAHSGKNNYWYGKRLSKEHKRKISQSNKGVIGFFRGKLRPEISGSNNPNWRGGISGSGYVFSEFNNKLKKLIRERDKNICQFCFNKQKSISKKNLNVHHIDYDKKNNNPTNLISLCDKCHTMTNWNRVKWRNHFERVSQGRGI